MLIIKTIYEDDLLFHYVLFQAISVKIGSAIENDYDFPRMGNIS